MEEVFQNPTFVLFAILFVGLAFGNLKVKGISLGSSGVLFAALVAGHYGLKVPDGVMGIGTALFVYCVGLGVGNRFFAALRSKGSKLVVLSVVVVVSAVLTAWGAGVVLGMDGNKIAGLFAGACSSTPAFAAATEGVDAGALADIGTGYALAYPFGVVGVILFIQLLPRLLKQDLNAPVDDASGKDPKDIISRVVEVTHPEVFGVKISDFVHTSGISALITRQVQDDLLTPLEADATFSEGMRVYLVGERGKMTRDIAMIGRWDKACAPRAFGDESKNLIVTDQAVCGKSLHDLDLLANYGILISRIIRLGVTFIPSSTTELQRNDIIRVVGKPQAIEAFGKACGSRNSAFNVTDIISLTGGVALGIVVGNITFSLGEGPGFSLGMAGGPLVVAILLGHFGKVGPIVGYIPRPTRNLLMEFALMMYLAGAGVGGGAHLVETLQEHGFAMFSAGMVITLVPLFVAYFVARKILRMDLPEALGGICGSMTSTPALGALTAKTDRQDPVIAYATAYPMALIFLLIATKVLMNIM